MSEAVPPPCWRVQDALRWAALGLVQVAEPQLSARMLLAHVLGCSTTDLFIHPERMLTAQQVTTYRGLVERRARHEPVAYLVGHRSFMDLDLVVDAKALIPRPETELLVERALHVAQRWPAPRIVDLGTGSGAIAVSLATWLPQAQVYALDRSSGALQVARQNAHRYGVAGRIAFLEGDLLDPLPTPVELIVANLPYVSEGEYAALPPDVRLFEPREALLAGPDGLTAIRALMDSAGSHLVDDGIILLEIGARQGPAVCHLAAQAFPGARVELLSDYAHLDRIVHVALGP
jgi:release factor glutamine methyltransferase